MEDYLEEIKDNYKRLADSVDIDGLSMLDVADKYLNETDDYNKDCYVSVLLLYCWSALEKLYYKQGTKVMSVWDCYDIFLDSFYYVMDKHVWKDPDNVLYNDEDAIIKAMYVLVESRRRNYFVAQNRQKRQVNQYPQSLDVLSEDFQEGYFSSMVDKYNFSDDWESIYVKKLWERKMYVSSIVFDTVLHMDVFDEQHVLNKKKLKKYIKNFDEACYTSFVDRYGIDDDISIFHKYIENIDDDRLYTYINNAIMTFKSSEFLRSVRDNNVNQFS